MCLINRLPGVTALLKRTDTNTALPRLLIFLFGSLAWAPFLSLPPRFFLSASLLVSLTFPPPPAPAPLLLPLSLLLSLRTTLCSDLSSSESYQSLETGIEGERKCNRNIQNHQSSYRDVTHAVSQTVLKSRHCMKHDGILGCAQMNTGSLVTLYLLHTS